MMRRMTGWVLVLVLILAAAATARAEVDLEAIFGPGYRLDGTVLVVPEGVTELGWFGEEGYDPDVDQPDDWDGEDADWDDDDWDGEDADWDDDDWDEEDADWDDDDWDEEDDPDEPQQYTMLSMSFVDDEDEWVQLPVTGVRLPSTLRRIGHEAFYDLACEGDLVIPEGVEEIAADAFVVSSADRLLLPSTLASLDLEFMDHSEFGEIVVSPDNPRYCTVDGVVFSRDMRTLMLYPAWKTDTHYDVPAGVQTIGRRAFIDNHYLQTVSLPIGLREIGELAFDSCGRLTAVNVPLTVTQIGRYAFGYCVSLQRVTLPPPLAHLLDRAQDETGVFAGCTALGSLFAGDNGGTGAERFDPATYVVEYGITHAYLANPENANKKIPLYRADAPGKKAVRQVPSGTVLLIREGEVTWQMLADNTPQAQWLTLDDNEGLVVSRDDVERCGDLLFRYETLAPKGKLTIYAQRDTSTAATRLSAARAKERWYYYSFYGASPWVQVIDTDAGWMTLGWCFLGDLTMTREAEGDGLILGVVIAEKIGNRVHLREKADKNSRSLGKYFTGTQMKIIGEKGNFWHVEIEDQTGWMMKDYVRVVREREN